MVYLDVQGEDGGCGDIRISFQSTNDANPGGTADPTYTHDSIDDLATQTAASSGEELVWNVPLEKAANTAELVADYIEPPEGYQLRSSGIGIKKTETETGENFTDENTTAWLGEDYEPDTSDSQVTCYNDQDGDGYGNSGSSTKRDSCQTGEVQNDSDCYDQNGEANPDQKSFFADDRGDGSFDYNCDGTAEKQSVPTGSCSGVDCSTNSCNASCQDYDSGWPSGAQCENYYDIGTQYYCQDAFGECNEKSDDIDSSLDCR